jgi:division protein CdvB (Snf7/Vps24/ESCRT-III family)
LGTISSLKLLGAAKDGEYKGKIVTALKEIELQRRELDGVKLRLSERRQKLFDSTVKAIQEKNNAKANIYANERAEVIKTIKVVETSELALTQVFLRLESIMEIGDAMVHMTSALKSLKAVSKTMEEFLPALDATSASINNTLTETMAQMGHITPVVSIDVRTENAAELVEQARKFAEDQSETLKQRLNVVPSMFEQEMRQSEDRIPILTTGDDYEEEESPTLGTIFTRASDPRVESEVLKYASSHDGVVDVSETSSTLGIPLDEVEQSTIRLVAQGKVKSQKSEPSR